MKKTYFLFAAIAIAQLSIAQEIPNANLDNWEAEGTHEIPVGWESSNEATNVTMVNKITAEKTDDAFSGEWAAKLTSKDILGINVSPGFITTARFEFDLFSQSAELYGGTYFPYRPTAINGYYKYSPANATDYCIVGVFLLKYNGDIADTVGYAEFNGTEEITEYTMFTADFEYITAEIPDSMQITILSSNPDEAVPESMMWVDNLSLDMPTGLNIPLMSENQFAYPNPSNGIIKLDIQEEAFVTVYDISGKQILQKKVMAGNPELDLQHLNKGGYIINVKTASYDQSEQIILQ